MVEILAIAYCAIGLYFIASTDSRGLAADTLFAHFLLRHYIKGY